MKVHFKKTIGIIGGAGPVASAQLYRRILEVCQEDFGAEDYHEFPHIVLVSFPFCRHKPEQIPAQLLHCVRQLTAAGAEVIGLASNSFHSYLPSLAGVPFVDLIAETSKALKAQGITRPLILSAPVTIASKLYERDGLSCLYPTSDDQKRVNRVIRDIAGGTITALQSESLSRVAQATPDAQAVVLACTELPVAHATTPLQDKRPILDIIDLLARKLVAAALGQ